MKFDSKLKWNEYADQMIKGANVCLFGKRMIRKYFTSAETRKMIKSIFFSKLYY